MLFKRYCKTMLLNDNSDLIEEYKKYHAPGAIWPEIPRGAKEVGIIDLEIYIVGNRLFMIMDTIPEFDHDKAMAEMAGKPRQQEWETFVSRFQQTSSDASADEKWHLMERIYEMDQEIIYKPENGQLKKFNGY